jgi:GntR family carbon starvation induced transcriptional regulator
MQSDIKPVTLADKAYTQLRHDIVRGAFEAGSPLRLAELGARYEMGFSPLREALNRLQAERLVTVESLRGFRVASLSLAEFEDSLATRLLIEIEALQLAIRHGDDHWAANIVSALYALKLQIERQDEAPDIWTLEERHHRFHRALLEACGSVWLLQFFESLYTANERFRIPVLLASTEKSTRDIHAEHAALAEATLARRTTEATDLLRDHYLRTAMMIRATMTESAPKQRVRA